MDMVLDGIRFVPATRLTVARGAWMEKWRTKANLAHLADLAPAEGEVQADAVLAEIIGRAAVADAVVPLIAGGIEREGQPWTEAQAVENMALIANADEALMAPALAEVLFGFIAREPALLRTMLRSSRPSGPGVDASSLEPQGPTTRTVTVASGDIPAGASLQGILIGSPASETGT